MARYDPLDGGKSNVSVVAPAGPVGPYGVLGFTPTPNSTGGGKQPIPIIKNAPVAPAKSTRTYTPAPASQPITRAPSVGSSATGTIAPVSQPAAPVAPSVDDFLAGDATFQGQNNALAKAFADYKNNQQLQTDQYNTQYNTNRDALTKQKTLDYNALQDDYASRGLMNSGLFAKASTDFENDYNTKFGSLDTGRSDFLTNLAAALGNYQSDQTVQADKARQDAINRRAAQYGV